MLTSVFCGFSCLCFCHLAHTFVAFIDIQKTFDTSWVEETFGSSVRRWLVSTAGHCSQVRVFSPLLFNLLVNGLIVAVRQVAPGVQLFSSSARSPGQLCADNLDLMAESQHDLQVAIDTVVSWARKWRFTFAIGPTKSATMVFGPQRHVPPCSVTLAGAPLLVVFEYLGVILTPLSWTPHAQHLVSRGNRLFAQCVAWCKSERLFAVCVHALHFLRVAEHLFSGSSWMLSTSPLVGCCLSLVGCTQCLRATGVHFLL